MVILELPGFCIKGYYSYWSWDGYLGWTSRCCKCSMNNEQHNHRYLSSTFRWINGRFLLLISHLKTCHNATKCAKLKLTKHFFLRFSTGMVLTFFRLNKSPIRSTSFTTTLTDFDGCWTITKTDFNINSFDCCLYLKIPVLDLLFIHQFRLNIK